MSDLSRGRGAGAQGAGPDEALERAETAAARWSD